MAHVLVTGGAGYIGSVLVQTLLNAGHHVTVVDNLIYDNGSALQGVYGHPHFHFIRDDFRAAATDYPWDAVVHLAAIVGETACNNHPSDAVAINQHGAIKFAEECKQAGIKTFIFASTCSNYGRVADCVAYENNPLDPLGLYAETKVAAEQGILPLADGSFRVAILRFATAYGTSPRMRFDTVLNEFAMVPAVGGKLLVVRNPKAWRPLYHVRSIAEAIAYTLGNENMHGVYNVGGYNVTKGELAQWLQLHAYTIAFEESDNDKRDYRVSFSRLFNSGFVPMIYISPYDGMQEVVNAIRYGLYDNPTSERYRNV